MSHNNTPQVDKVSIVIPIYNAEKTLQKSLASLKKQSYQNIQVILVDDASTDQSIKVIKESIGSDDRFQLIHQTQNSGASAARNRGISQSNAEYLFFLDADDWLEPNAIEILVHLAKQSNSDLVCASHFQDFDHQSIQKNDESPQQDHVFTKKELTLYIKNYLKSPYKHTLFVHCWGKLYKLKHIQAHGIQFDENLSQLEDVSFNFLYLSYCISVAYKCAYLYHHRISPSSQSLSTMTGKESNATKKTLTAYQNVKDFILIYDKEKLIDADKEVSHLFITTMIITIIRLCKSMINTPSMETYRKIAHITKSPEVSNNLSFYTPASNESTVIPLALKTKLPFLVLISGLIRVYMLPSKK